MYKTLSGIRICSEMSRNLEYDVSFWINDCLRPHILIFPSMIIYSMHAQLYVFLQQKYHKMVIKYYYIVNHY